MSFPSSSSSVPFEPTTTTTISATTSTSQSTSVNNDSTHDTTLTDTTGQSSNSVSSLHHLSVSPSSTASHSTTDSTALSAPVLPIIEQQIHKQTVMVEQMTVNDHAMNETRQSLQKNETSTSDAVSIVPIEVPVSEESTDQQLPPLVPAEQKPAQTVSCHDVGTTLDAFAMFVQQLIVFDACAFLCLCRILSLVLHPLLLPHLLLSPLLLLIPHHLIIHCKQTISNHSL